ncbi:septation regulator SpoVG [Oceanivirga salmonicida]|uniref:septation regulator SpoVG n=1 Tax=Oceanivirga salmonicida TaxID=1769291 RepID=UPI00082F1608|nr:septation regulator SpoVG [Oceanivirga salmonicida]
MTITDTKIRLIKSTEEELKLRAYVDITFDNCFVVHGLKIIDGQNGLFIAMPSKKISTNEFKDIVHPIQAEFRKEITDIILAKYEEEKNKEE